MRPPKILERVVGALLPASCREEVLGDLYERYRNPAQYAWEALRTVPRLIFSTRRSAVPLALLEATAAYGCFLAAAWDRQPGFLVTRWAFLCLGIPFAAVLVGCLCPMPGRKPRPLADGPMFGLQLFGWFFQMGLRWTWQQLALPDGVFLDGVFLAMPMLTMVTLYGQRPDLPKLETWRWWWMTIMCLTAWCLHGEFGMMVPVLYAVALAGLLRYKFAVRQT